MKTQILIIICLCTTTLSAKNIVDGYYVTQNGDTINSKFVISNLFALHRQITQIDSADNPIVLTPDNVRSFSFRVSDFININKQVDEINHTYEDLLTKQGYLYKRKTFSLDAEINARPFLGDSIENYRSIEIGNGKRIFVSIDNDKNETLQSAVYYTKLHPDKPYLVSTIWLLIKDNRIVNRENKEVNEWVAETIGEYKTLSNLVENKKINAFPWDFKFVVDDYNSWYDGNKPDTTLYLKGLIDAQKHYKVIAPFTVSYITGTAFFLPGLVTAVIVSHIPKEKNIKVKGNLELKENTFYENGFQHKAYDKRYRAASKGAIFGGLTCIVFLIVLL